MDEPIVSAFNSSHYLRGICGAAFFIWMTGDMLYRCLSDNLLNHLAAYAITIILFGVDFVYYYFFSKSWKKITITDTEIIIYDIIFRKTTTIPLTAINNVNTYRTPGAANSYGNVFSQDFVIGFNDNRWLSFNEAWYQNYSKLTMAIYTQKYGPGHGRERYLARHSR